jgi:hypothetical protein
MIMSRKERWMFGALAFIAGLVGGMISNRFLPQPALAHQGKAIEAEQIRIVDDKGEVRAFLGLFDNGESSLVFYDINSKKIRAAFSHSPDKGPMLTLYNKEGTPRATLRQYPTLGPELILLDEDDEHRVVLGLTNGGEPGLALQDREGATRAALGILPTGNPMFGFNDRNGGIRIMLGLEPPNDEPSFLINNKDEKTIWKAPN